VLATSRTPYYQQAAEMGAEFYEDPDDFCEEHPDVVILATSILSTEPVLRSLPLTRLKRSTLVVDVLSVKVCVLVGISCKRVKLTACVPAAACQAVQQAGRLFAA
jgi:prephenate dehydrogenase